MKTEHTCWVNGWHAARDASLGKESASTLTLRRLFSAGGMFMVDQDQLEGHQRKMIARLPRTVVVLWLGVCSCHLHATVE